MPIFKRIEVVANCASGSVGPTAPAELESIFADAGLDAHICAPEHADLGSCLKAAVDSRPDLLVILAGDGTARSAAELCGPDGPMIAPLAGGTMNMLPHAVYGVRPWQEALREILVDGEERVLSGGQVEGHQFLVSAIFGAPAMWAPAREAVRAGDARKAWMKARRALRRAFNGRLRYMLGDGQREKAEALVFMCPLLSRALDDDTPGLEAAAMDLKGAGDAFRLGVNALMGDWRSDPAVEVEVCQRARLWAAHGIPAILDGETVHLRSLAEVTFQPKVARVLAPREAQAPQP